MQSVRAVIQCENKSKEEIEKEIEALKKDGYKPLPFQTVYENKVLQIYMEKVIDYETDFDKTK